MKKADSFIFSSYKLASNKKEVALNYVIHFDDKKIIEFTETITFPEPLSNESPELEQALDATLHTLHLACGLSYWKTYCPSNIEIKTKPLTKEQAQFWNIVYTKGLGEFFYRNKIDFRALVNFPYDENVQTKPVSIARQERALMGVGGGKDSLVTYELLKKLEVPVQAYILETQKGYDVINEVVKTMDVQALRFTRAIDAKLFDTTLLEGAYNGHIPITAIYSVIGVLAALLYDFTYVVLSNEKSADYGNVMYLNETINHQWSKSVEFEKLFKNYIHTTISSNISYFSLLRPWTEMRITEEFINYPQYFDVFSSCNTNFKVYKTVEKSSKWCGVCPKCAFVFTMLAANLPKQLVIDIFKKNLFDDENLSDLYKELLGIKDFKPFECVGTPDEMRYAFYKAYKKGEYKNDVIMQMFEKDVLPTMKNKESTSDFFSLGDTSLIPNKFKKAVII